ncbi:UNVERIFIED_CONTAM: Major facilitator super domain-containing protein 7 [Siphonaria sp. JEL0065]|nr:Major facilitator super domain-containing protein 7 [Siphonaria sp. JEL0065]
MEFIPTKLYPFRFVVLLAVFLGNINNAIVWSTYAAVTPSAALHYGVSSERINQLVLFFDVCFFPFAFVAPYVLDVYGLRPSVLIGTWVTVLGTGVRWLSGFASEGYTIPLLFTGQLLAALVNPFTLDAPTKVAALWFGENERLQANTVMSLATFLGSALVLPIAPWIVNEDPDNIDKLNLITFLITLVLALPSLVIRNSPPTPPSLATQEDTMPFWDGVKALSKNTQFILLFLVAGLSMGTFEVYITLISDSIVPFGYSEADSGSLGLITIISGVITSFVLARILDHSQSHRKVLKVLPFIAFMGMLGFCLCASYADKRVFLYLSAAVIGIGCFPILPIVLEVGAESARPVAEGTSGGILETSIQLFAIFILIISNWLRDANGKLGNALIWLVAVFGIVALLVPFLDDEASSPEERQTLLE